MASQDVAHETAWRESAIGSFLDLLHPFQVHREKPTLTPIHRVALFLLALTAGRNLFSLVMKPAPHWSSLEQLGTVFGIGSLWALFLWKVWTRPRSWGRGVGFVMVLIVPLHLFMWYRGVQYLRRTGQEIEFVPALLELLPYEILFFVTGIVCLMLAKRSAPKAVK
jgi:hypothetical protein